jgi:hypothetical protein
MAQFGRPDGEISTGNWTTSPLDEKIDEVTPADGDFVRSENDPASDAFEVSLGDVTDPVSSAGHNIKVRATKRMSGGGQPGVIDLTMELYEGTTQIATQTDSDIADAVFTTRTLTLSAGEADSISDYTDLRIRITANKSAGARTSWCEVSWAEFECPDLASAATPVIPFSIGQDPGDDTPPLPEAMGARYFRKPEGPKPYPVIPQRVGQWKGQDEEGLDYRESKFTERLPFSGTFPAEPVIPFRMGQWIGDDTEPAPVRTEFRTVLPGVPPAATANPVIAYRRGEMYVAREGAIIQAGFYRLAAQVAAVATVTPVIDPTVSEQVPEEVREILAGFQKFVPFAGTFPAEAVIPYFVGQWTGDADYEYIPVPKRWPVIPFLSISTMSPPGQLVSPYMWFDEPPQESYPWDPSEAPRYFKWISLAYEYTDEEGFGIVLYDRAQYSNPVVFLEVVLKTSGPNSARARLYNITDDVPVAVGGVDTLSTSFVRIRSAAIPLAGAKEYKVQSGRLPPSLTKIQAARLVVRS